MTPARRRAWEDWLNARWYGAGPGVLYLLWPLKLLFAGVVALRRRWWRDCGRPQAQQLPVIVVGNIVVGGAGKTPVVIALVRALQQRGFRPGIVSRGYGGSARAPCLLTANASAAEVGDEARLLAQATGVPVAVGRKRAAAAALLQTTDCDLVIADDGLQHYALARDMEIAVIPGGRRHGNGHLLPLGPLREPVSRLQGCDFRLVLDGPAGPDEWAVQSQTGDLQPLSGGPALPLAQLAGQEVVAAVAIAHPQAFLHTLQAAGLRVAARVRPDHHAWTAAEFADLAGRPVILTAKDAVKCAFLRDRAAYSLQHGVTLPAALVDAIAARLRPS